MRTAYIALFSIGLSVAAQFALKAGVAEAQRVATHLEQPVLPTQISYLAEPLVLLGLLLYALGAVAWLSVLAEWDVSKAYPIVGLGFALTAIIGYLLGEHLTLSRMIGVGMICSGVYLVSQS